MSIIPSKRQQNIYDCWTNEDTNIIVEAVAGSGKTSTLIELLKISPYRTLILAFNKSIQLDLEEKIDELGLSNKGKAMTLHSLGLNAIKKVYKDVKINDGKFFDLFYGVLLKQNKKLFKNIHSDDLQKIFFSIRDLSDISRIFLTDDLNVLIPIATNMDKIIYDNNASFDKIWEKFVEIRESTYDSETVEVDFIDMLYLPVKRKLYIPVRPVYLFVDEVQDLNLAQCLLIKQLIDQGDVRKACFVGDEKQSIYGFSGAYGESFEFFKQLGPYKAMPLDINYRCSSSIIDMANRIYGNLVAFKTDEGIVRTIHIPSDPKQVTFDIANVKDHSMIICRNTLPLIDLFFKLVSIDKHPTFAGSDILNKVLTFIKPYKNQTIAEVKTDMKNIFYTLKTEMERSKDDRTKNNNAMKFYIYQENCEIFEKLVKELCNNDRENINDFSVKLKQIFSKDSTIKLCTIHKSKGLEADIVYILNEDLIPSPHAKSIQQKQQEENLKYVARTRAKKELYFLNFEDYTKNSIKVN